MKSPSTIDKFLAWLVHLYTATGVIVGFFALIAISNQSWSDAYLLLLICLFIDGTDGTLARLASVDKVLPDIEGKNIDYVIDFFSYAIIPAYFYYSVQPEKNGMTVFAIIIILLSSALYYGKKNMVVEDQYFEGFPVLWNMVVFFQFFVFDNHPVLNFWSVVFFGILHFIPWKYPYPSRARRFLLSHIFFSFIGLGSALVLILHYPSPETWAKGGVLIAAGYFLYMTWNESRRLRS